MNQAPDISDFYKQAHGDRIKRRRLEQAVLVTTILGLLSIAISLLFFAMGMLMLNVATQRYLFLAGVYFGGGIVMFLARTIASRIHVRLSPHRQEKRNQNDFYHRSTSRRKHGAALVVALSILAIITLLLAHGQIRALQAQRRDQTLLLRARLQVAAADAARNALLRLAADEDMAVDHTNETWAVSGETQDPVGITTYARVIDQNRFFNLNNLAVAARQEFRTPAAIVMDILTLCGDLTPAEKLDALMDWVDEDDHGPAERRFYKDLDLDYGPANRGLYSWGEWLHVAGFDRGYFRRHERRTLVEVFSANVVDTIAIIPGRRTSPVSVNVNTASQTVLAGVLGLEHEELAAVIVGIRNLRPIRSLDELSTIIPPALMLRVGGYLDTKSRFFTVQAWAYADGRTEHLLALVERNSAGDVTVLQWVM